ncbi:hypothetical protein AXG93_4804s1160 [Marchantia polymorpha subsp. ruderalis]|uniref:Uncharacterized protein n=1 Tax=Marchantia polymorpha subsp. ruderalis TaxID=1480154 RepID=A0A176VP11_MARPO|nr:hypothetical protein AXG93_4804s1160 [Marchantia polymorpha subsp. ruderalis]
MPKRFTSTAANLAVPINFLLLRLGLNLLQYNSQSQLDFTEQLRFSYYFHSLLRVSSGAACPEATAYIKSFPRQSAGLLAAAAAGAGAGARRGGRGRKIWKQLLPRPPPPPRAPPHGLPSLLFFESEPAALNGAPSPSTTLKQHPSYDSYLLELRLGLSHLTLLPSNSLLASVHSVSSLHQPLPQPNTLLAPSALLQSSAVQLAAAAAAAADSELAARVPEAAVV